jgi:hypothetical protein
VTEERAPFAKKLDVLERNRWLRGLSLALMISGPAMFAAFLAKVFPPGLLGVHATILGIVLAVAVGRTNMRAQRKSRDVRASAEGVRVDGVLHTPRARIADGFFQPRWSHEEGGFRSSVRLVDKRRRVAFEAEVQHETEALQLLYALGLDPGSKRAEFRGSSPMFATLGRNFAFVFGAMFTMGVCTAVLGALGVDAFGLFPLMLPLSMFAGMIPTKIAVGIDGILLRWLWIKTFVPMSKITRFVPEDDRIIRLTLSDGTEKVVYTSMRRKGGPTGFGAKYASQHRDAVLARMTEASRAFHARTPAADVTALVGRGSRTREEWFDSLAKLGASDGGYRDAVVREDDLWRVVEDPAAPEDARAGAMVVLRPKLDDAGKQRVRIAAEATASPRLRVVLERASSDHDLRDAVGELSEEVLERQLRRS